MIVRRLQFIFAMLLLGWTANARAAEFQTGSSHQLSFRDVDGNDLATSDGHVTIIAVVTRQNEEQAHAVADQVPDRYLGNPRYRYVTLVNFQGKLAGPLRGVTQAVIRRRLEAEAKKLKPQYVARQITRNPRRDLYVVADFDGGAAAQLGIGSEKNEVAVFVFDKAGKLTGRWTGVPPGDSLAQAIAAAD